MILILMMTKFVLLLQLHPSPHLIYLTNIPYHPPLSFPSHPSFLLLPSPPTPLGGTFTIAFGSFALQLPGTVTGLSLDTTFATTADLSPYLQPGDQVMVDGQVYTVAPFRFINRYDTQSTVN